MKIALVAGVLFFSSCTGQAEFGWNLTDEYNETLARFNEAVALAGEVVEHPACRSRLAGLPAWPVGRVPIKWVEYWPDGSTRLLARTLWRNAGEYEPIPPRIEIHARVLLDGSTKYAAGALIHELVHAASWTLFEGLEGTHMRDAMVANEALAQDISRICMQTL